MPVTLLTLPRELRDEIYLNLALSSSFTFLCTNHQVNAEGTPLLYKHGIHRIRALTLRGEHLPKQLPLQPSSLIPRIQNLYISMPPLEFGYQKGPHYEIPRRAISLMEQFAGTEIRRRVCHFDLQSWTLSRGMGKALSGYGGFDVVRVEVRLKPYNLSYEGRLREMVLEFVNAQKRKSVRIVERRLESALGKARWENKDSGNCFEEVIVAEFRPRASRT